MSEPSTLPPEPLPTVILGCKVFQHWLEQLLPPGSRLADKVTYFDYGLHAVPKNLRLAIQQAVDAIEQPSLVVLAFGLCGNGLNNIQSGKHYLLIPRSDDCIAIHLGSYQAYLQEMQREPGTYYLSKGWLEAGTNPLQESRNLEAKYGPAKASWLMDYQYQKYKRLIMVARNPQELQEYRTRAIEVAEYCARWGMRYEERIGGDQFLRKLVDIALDLRLLDEEFVLIPPGGLLTQSHFIRF